MKMKFRKSELLVTPWKIISLCVWNVMKYLQYEFGWQKNNLGRTHQPVWAFLFLVSILVVTAREAGSMSFCSANKWFLLFLRNPMKICLKTNMECRLKSAYLKVSICSSVYFLQAFSNLQNLYLFTFVINLFTKSQFLKYFQILIQLIKSLAHNTNSLW